MFTINYEITNELEIMLNFWLILSSILLVSNAVKSGPLVIASKGEVWPKPQNEEKSINYYVICSKNFIFKVKLIEINEC